MIKKSKLNKVYNMDCIKLMKKFPDKSIDLIVSSPPYNCNILYDVHDDNMLWKDYINWCKDWLRECKRILKNDGRFAINVLIEMELKIKEHRRVSPYATYIHIIENIGLNLKGTALWTDNHRTNLSAWGSYKSCSSPYIYNPYEAVIIGYKKVWKKQNKGKSTINKDEFIKGVSGIWNIGTEGKGLTIANFPEALPKMCIKLLSYENDVIYDPFSGSGTTGLVAEKLKRKWVASEISKNYYNISKKRISEYRKLEKLRILK